MEAWPLPARWSLPQNPGVDYTGLNFSFRHAMTAKIFINYRRGDDSGAAGRLFDRLERSFAAEQLFIDVDRIEPGRDFVVELQEQVAACDVVLAIIGRSWLDARDGEGRRRLDDPHDFVRIELEAALKLGKRVVPVLVNDTTMPRAEQLPEGLRGLVRRNAVRLSHERFRADADGLIKSIETAAASRATASRSAESDADDAARTSRIEGPARRPTTFDMRAPLLGGALSAALSTAFSFSPIQADQTAGANWLLANINWFVGPFSIPPALFFGCALVWVMRGAPRLTVFNDVWLIGASVLAWIVSPRFAIQVYDQWTGHWQGVGDGPKMAVAGIPSGGLGALIVVASVAVLTKPMRHPLAIICVTLVGSIAGLASGLIGSSALTIAPLFLTWQVSILAAIALLLRYYGSKPIEIDRRR